MLKFFKDFKDFTLSGIHLFECSLFSLEDKNQNHCVTVLFKRLLRGSYTYLIEKHKSKKRKEKNVNENLLRT